MSGYAPTDLRQQQQANDARERRMAATRVVEEEDYRWLLGDARGRRIVSRLLEQTRMRDSSWSPNALEMARNEGRREIGVALLRLVERVAPGAVALLVKENQTDTGN